MICKIKTSIAPWQMVFRFQKVSQPYSQLVSLAVHALIWVGQIARYAPIEKVGGKQVQKNHVTAFFTHFHYSKDAVM
jgi:hypothetical protein